MKTLVNKILLIVLKNERRLSFTLPNDIDVQAQYLNILISEGLTEEDVKTNYFFPNTPLTADHYANFFDEETQTIDERAIATEFKLEEFRKQRAAFFTALDLEFMKSMEEDCEECKKHVVEIKNYLRNLPFELSKKFTDLDAGDILTFNAFNNVLGINIINGGSGYTSPPEIIISEPEQSGFQLEARTIIKDGAVSEVIVTQSGSGYTQRPRISVARPDAESGETAILIARNIENDNY